MVTAQSQSPAVVKFNIFYKWLSFESKDHTKELKTVGVQLFWAKFTISLSLISQNISVSF